MVSCTDDTKLKQAGSKVPDCAGKIPHALRGKNMFEKRDKFVFVFGGQQCAQLLLWKLVRLQIHLEKLAKGHQRADGVVRAHGFQLAAHQPVHRAACQRQAKHIGKVVRRVREQCCGVGEETGRAFDGDEAEVQRNCDGITFIAGRGMLVGVIAMIVCVPMMPMHGVHLVQNRANGKAALTGARTQFSWDARDKITSCTHAGP